MSSNLLITPEPGLEPPPTLFEEYENKNNESELLICNKCSSQVEIISIDNEEMKITFKCLNNKYNHGTQTILINDYLKDIEKIYSMNKCFICNKQRKKNNKNKFKYCIKCENYICKECINKHNNNYINKDEDGHILLNNKEIKINCFIHSENEIIEYCLDCKKHICLECLKTREHIMHRKNNIYEIQPSIEEKIIHNKIINLLKEEKNKLEKEKENKIKELYNKKIYDMEQINNYYNNSIIFNKQKKKKELEINKNMLIDNLDELKKKYTNDIKKANEEYKKVNNTISDKYKIINKKNEIYKNIKLKELNIAYNNEMDNYKNQEKIEKLNELIKINEIIKNTQEKYKNNYYNNISLINILFNYYNNNILKNLFDNNNNFIEKLYKKEKENQKLIEEKNIINNLKRENQILKQENKEINNLKNEIQNLLNINEKLQKENENYKKKYNKSENFVSNPNNIIFGKDIINDSYCDTDLDNTFTIFTSFNDNISYIVYSTLKKSIKCFNLEEQKQVKEILNAHSFYITNFHHCYNKNINKDIIMSISKEDKVIKIWETENWECILNLSNIYKIGYLSSGCFLNYKNNYYIVACNRINSDLIKIYDLKGDKIKEIKESNNSTLVIDVYYDKNKDNYYIITGNVDDIKSYDYTNNEIYHKYKNNEDKKFHFSFGIINSEDKVKIIDSSEEECIFIWDFHSANLLKKIIIDKILLRGICIWNKDYIFVGCDDKTIKLIDIKEGSIVKSLTGICNWVCTIKKINLPEYGECLLSQGIAFDKIKIWMNKK